jgi:hypothetical protein
MRVVTTYIAAVTARDSAWAAHEASREMTALTAREAALRALAERMCEIEGDVMAAMAAPDVTCAEIAAAVADSPRAREFEDVRGRWLDLWAGREALVHAVYRYGSAYVRYEAAAGAADVARKALEVAMANVDVRRAAAGRGLRIDRYSVGDGDIAWYVRG